MKNKPSNFDYHMSQRLRNRTLAADPNLTEEKRLRFAWSCAKISLCIGLLRKEHRIVILN